MTEAFIAHSEKQANAILSQKPVVVCLTGIQWGKSRVGAVRTQMFCNQYHEKTDNFLVTAPTYKIMQQATLPAFLQRMEGLGRYSKVDAVFEIHGAGKVFFRTETDPDSIVGITDVRHIWGDEAGKYRLYFWENIQARAAFKQCPITLTTSVYARNWIYKELYKPFMAGQRDDVDLFKATSRENPYFSSEHYDRIKRTMDPRRFAMIFGAEFGHMEGLVYDCWDEDENICEPFHFPFGTKFVAGVDWGYNPDPFALVVRAITPDGLHYQVHEFCKTNCTITDMIMIARQLAQIYGIKAFYCDPSQPGYIEEFNRNKLSAIPADNDINRGIGRHYDLIKTRRYKVFRGSSPYTIDEMETYHYPEPKDLGPDETSKEQKPVGQNDHCLDANRYATIETYRSEIKFTPKTLEEQNRENQTQRINRLKRVKSRRVSHSETWSK